MQHELFIDQPDEDWVQCLNSKEWFHEQCGNDNLPVFVTSVETHSLYDQNVSKKETIVKV